MPTKANSVRSEPRLVARQSRSGSTAAQLTKIRTKANFRHPSKVRITRIQNQTQFPARVGQAPHRTATPSAEFKTKPISVPRCKSHRQKCKTKPNSPRASDVPLETTWLKIQNQTQSRLPTRSGDPQMPLALSRWSPYAKRLACPIRAQNPLVEIQKLSRH